MKIHKFESWRWVKPLNVVTLFIIAITGVISIAAYAVENTRDDQINDVKRIRQEQLMGLQRIEIAVSPYEAENSFDDYINEVKRMRQEQLMEAQQPEIAVSPIRESEDISEMPPQGIITQAQNESEEWMLVLVNAENPLPDNHSLILKSLPNGLQFDERAIDQLNEMLSAMRKQGLSPVVCSAYRTIEFQRTLFNNKVSLLVASGFSQTQAETEARKSIAYPGTSEHNLGLAADIVSMDYQLLDDKQAETPEVRWLLENCVEYGFILRYPRGKEAITGITNEPWHFRFVGVTAAQAIMESGLCFEEYLGTLIDKRSDALLSASGIAPGLDPGSEAAMTHILDYE